MKHCGFPKGRTVNTKHVPPQCMVNFTLVAEIVDAIQKLQMCKNRKCLQAFLGVVVISAKGFCAWQCFLCILPWEGERSTSLSGTQNLQMERNSPQRFPQAAQQEARISQQAGHV